MSARHPSIGLTRAMMLWLGIPVLLASVIVAPLTADVSLTGLAWYVPGWAAYVAGVIAFRARPENLAVRRLLAFGVLVMLFNTFQNVVLLRYLAVGEQAWLGPANLGLQVLGLGMMVVLLGALAVYPEGGYQRRYELALVRGFGALVVLVPLAMLLARPTLEPAAIFGWATGSREAAEQVFPDIASPLHVGALAFLEAPLRTYVSIAFTWVPLWAGIVLALRYRRLRTERRLQARWPMYGGIATLVLGIEGTIWHATDGIPIGVSTTIEVVALVVVVASLVIGLVRPDLFDIDRAMRRSLVYVPLWIAIAGSYIGVAALLGLAASGAGLQLAIAVTIVATVLFEPARRALVARAGRWAFGESLSGEELVRRLGATLEHTLDSEQLTQAIVTTAREGLGVRWAQIQCDDSLTVTDGEPPRDGERPVLSAPLVHAGQPLGEISCGPRVRGRVQASDRELFETLARQAALALHNARLAGELGRSLEALQAQATELAASRSRIVAAQEAARRQIERDIHDGAQELVALIARIGLARSQLTRNPDRLGETLGDLQVEARQALENLRQLASGIHPAVLSDHGIVEAIESRAARFPLGVTIECDPQMRTARFGEAVEGAAYFFVCEGFANALKHARAERVRVRLSRAAGALEVEVSDDGGGFDVGVTARSGLAGLADRVEALGGRLDVDSATGRGTTLTARLPLDEAQAAVV